MLLLAMTFVLLPILPDRPIDPWGIQSLRALADDGPDRGCLLRRLCRCRLPIRLSASRLAGMTITTDEAANAILLAAIASMVTKMTARMATGVGAAARFLIGV
jgi:uncharacterized membrane protein (DUF4010 family)